MQQRSDAALKTPIAKSTSEATDAANQRRRSPFFIFANNIIGFTVRKRPGDWSARRGAGRVTRLTSRTASHPLFFPHFFPPDRWDRHVGRWKAQSLPLGRVSPGSFFGRPIFCTCCCTFFFPNVSRWHTGIALKNDQHQMCASRRPRQPGSPGSLRLT